MRNHNITRIYIDKHIVKLGLTCGIVWFFNISSAEILIFSLYIGSNWFLDKKLKRLRILSKLRNSESVKAYDYVHIVQRHTPCFGPWTDCVTQWTESVADLSKVQNHYGWEGTRHWRYAEGRPSLGLSVLLSVRTRIPHWPRWARAQFDKKKNEGLMWRR